MPVPAPQQFSIQPMLSAFSQGRAAKVALEDRQRALEQQATDAIIRAADLADTPEKWDRFITTIGAQFPDADLSEFADFSSREAAIAQSMDPYQRAQLDLARRDQEMQERAFAAAERRANAPTPQLTDETVNGVLGQRNPVTNAFEPYPEWMQTTAGGAEIDFENENALRDDFERLTANQRAVSNSYQTIQAVADNPSPAGDISLIFSYMRMLDPTSTVREGEFATAEQTTGLPGQLVNTYNRLVDGYRLNDEQRADFAAQAGRLATAAERQYNDLAAYFTENATAYNMDPTRVVRPWGTPSPEVAAPDGFVTPVAPAPAAPAAGFGVVPGPAAPPAAAPVAAPTAAAPVTTPEAPANRADITPEALRATVQAWGAAGYTAAQAIAAIAERYGIDPAEVRSMLGLR